MGDVNKNQPTPAPKTQREALPPIPKPSVVTRKEIAKLKAEYERFAARELDTAIYGKPNAGKMAMDAHERINALQGNQDLQKGLRLTVINTMNKIFDAMAERAHKEGLNAAETRRRLQTLDGYMRTMGVMGQTTRLMNDAYAETDGTRLRVQAEVMDEEESLQINKFADFIGRIDVDETLRMIEENQLYTSMLVEEMNAHSLSIADMDPNKGRQGPREDSKYYKTDTMVLNKDRVRRLDLANPNCRPEYLKLIAFIMGDAEAGKPVKSANRKNVESMMWASIIRAMDIDQKKYLLETMAETRGVESAQNTITLCVVGGMMNVVDVNQLRANSRQLAGIKDSFMETLPAAVKKGNEYKERMRRAAERVRNPKIECMTDLLTFNNIALETVGRIGLVTALVNFGLAIAERVKKRREHSRHEGLATAIAKGAFDGLTNGYAIGGAATAVFSFDAIYPFLSNIMHAPSQEEIAMLNRKKGVDFMKSNLSANRPLAEYFFAHYDGFCNIAETNKSNTNFKQKKGEERGAAELYIGDIHLTKDEAKKMGYASQAEAIGALIKLFTVSRTQLGLENQKQLNAYLIKIKVKSNKKAPNEKPPSALS